ncbi:MAG TPA: hypothetical protein PLQ13_04480, partial [Candidatus Krumholzibacteria bacterium]|nr:hypothetical protein [Candidatus Krumholzibacteria bacterium]
MRSTRILTAILALGLLATGAAAQTPVTPSDACAADSLYLVSPDVLDMHLQEAGRLGLILSWPNLDLGEATCYSLKDIEGLGFDPVVTGGFGDRVDRILAFTTSDSGTIGGSSTLPLQVAWRSEGATTYGNLAGVL